MKKEEKKYPRITKDVRKALDDVQYENFINRTTPKEHLTVIQAGNEEYAMIHKHQLKEYENSIEYLRPKDYSEMDFDHIESIYTDLDPLPHWESIKGMFSTEHGETLRFILAMKLPLEKFIRYELAARGHDIDHHWVGFEKAREVWLNEDK